MIVVTGEIELKDVTFRYDNDGKSIYENFSLKIPGKKTSFIVGESGLGKSTIFNLIVPTHPIVPIIPVLPIITQSCEFLKARHFKL